MLTEKVVIIYKFILKNKSHKKVEKDSWYTILISGHLEPTMEFLYSHINRDILRLKFQPNITMEILGKRWQQVVTRKIHSHQSLLVLFPRMEEESQEAPCPALPLTGKSCSSVLCSSSPDYEYNGYNHLETIRNKLRE